MFPFDDAIFNVCTNWKTENEKGFASLLYYITPLVLCKCCKEMYLLDVVYLCLDVIHFLFAPFYEPLDNLYKCSFFFKDKFLWKLCVLFSSYCFIASDISTPALKWPLSSERIYKDAATEAVFLWGATKLGKRSETVILPPFFLENVNKK